MQTIKDEFLFDPSKMRFVIISLRIFRHSIRLVTSIRVMLSHRLSRKQITKYADHTGARIQMRIDAMPVQANTHANEQNFSA